MKINKSLLPLKTHYFLRYAGTAFLTIVLPTIVRQKGVSPQCIGFMWFAKTIIGFVANSTAGTIADYFNAHRVIFLLSIVFVTAGYVSTYALPPLPFGGDSQSYVLQDISSITESTNDTQRELFFPEESIVLPHFNSTKPQSFSLTGDLLHNKIDPELAVDEGELFPAVADSPEYMSTTNLIKYPQFWLIFIAVMTEQIGLSTVVMITDAVCFQILGTERHKYGQQRLWGTVGMGLMSVITGALVDLYSKGQPQTDYLPAVIIGVVLMTFDLIIVAKMDIKSSQESKIKLEDVGRVIAHPGSIIFFITVFVMGTSLSVLWVFKLLYIEDVASTWDPNFPNLKLLQGIDVGIESFGGEVPFFFLSGMIIKRLGHNKVFACCIGTLAIRCCLYFTVSNPWWFLPIEFLNGISFALFYACMNSYASQLAPPGAQATLQALVRAFFLVGMSTASLIGGVLYQSIGGARMYLSIGIFDAFYCVIFLICQFLVTKYSSRRKLLDHSGYSSTSTRIEVSSNKCHKEEDGKDTKESLMEDV